MVNIICGRCKVISVSVKRVEMMFQGFVQIDYLCFECRDMVKKLGIPIVEMEDSNEIMEVEDG